MSRWGWLLEVVPSVMLETFGLGAITHTCLCPPLGMSGAKQKYEHVHALSNAHCQVSNHAPSRGHSCPILMADNDMTMFNQLINGPGFSWRDTLQLPKESVFCRWWNESPSFLSPFQPTRHLCNATPLSLSWAGLSLSCRQRGLTNKL